MKKLVRNGIEHVEDHARRSQRDGCGYDRAVAMFHPVSATPWYVVSEERVRAGLELRVFAEHRTLLVHDLLGTRHVFVDLHIRCIVMNGSLDRQLLAVRVANLERADRLRAELSRTVHHVLEVRRRERPRIVRRKQLRGGDPRQPLRRLECQAHRAGLESMRPHQGRGQVHVCVCRVDSKIGAVDVITVDLVNDPHRAVVTGNVPLIGVGP